MKRKKQKDRTSSRRRNRVSNTISLERYGLSQTSTRAKDLEIVQLKDQLDNLLGPSQKIANKLKNMPTFLLN